jgi:hypothetical protein
MSLKRSEWLEMLARKSLKRDSSNKPVLSAMVKAEVGAGQLTNHQAWNWFLQILEAMKREAEEGLAAAEAGSRKSDDFSHEGLARVQAIRRAWYARAETLGEVMELPRQIVDDAEKAKEILETLNHAETNEKPSGPAVA